MKHMHSRRMFSVVLSAFCVAAAACSDEGAGGIVGSTTKQTATGTQGGTDTTHTPIPTSNGPVATVRVSPQQLTINVGTYAFLSALPLDAKGVRVVGKQTTWRSSDAAIATMSDTGIVYGKATGTAKVYGTIDGITDSATVTVVPAPTPNPTPAPVASFNLEVIVAGAVVGADTSRSTPVAGITVKLTRVGSVTGDTLNPSVDAGTFVTDANGRISAKALTGGYYVINALPPDGSPFDAAMAAISAPRVSDVSVRLVVRRKP